MSALESRIPPPVVAIVIGTLMWALAPMLSMATVRVPGLIPAAGTIAAVGFLAEIAAAANFLRAGTTVDPLHPARASTLVVSGLNRFSRNPIYVGDLLILLGWAFYLANVATLVGPVLFMVYMDRFQIRPEERALSELFGERYADYCGRVRRWL